MAPMPDQRHELEAAKILTEMGACVPDSRALAQSRRVLAEALEKAERRGRQSSGREKQASG
jgi:hypothetical protein